MAQMHCVLIDPQRGKLLFPKHLNYLALVSLPSLGKIPNTKRNIKESAKNCRNPSENYLPRHLQVSVVSSLNPGFSGLVSTF